MKLDYTKVDSVQEKDVPYLDEGVEKTADLIRTTYTPTNFEGTTTSFSIRGTHPETINLKNLKMIFIDNG